jgi:hypothetical protein
VSGTTISCPLYYFSSTNAGDVLSVTLDQITNPLTIGSDSVSVSTSADTKTATGPVTITTAPGLFVSAVSPSTGDVGGGTPVTVFGSGFTDATEVDFDGVAASDLAAHNDGSLTVVSPPGSAGPADVTVTTPSGTSAINAADEFTYTVEQSPTVVSCSSDSSCSDTVSSTLNDTTVTATGAASTSSSISLVVNPDTLSCGASYDYTTPVSTLVSSGFATGTLLTVTETVDNEPSTAGVQVCYEGPGATTAQFLPACKKKKTSACLQSLAEHTGGVLATFLVPANDPRFWTGGAPLAVKSFTPAKGVPGTNVTIKGKNLTGAVSVVIGGTKAIIKSASSTKLVVTVPQGALTGIISITSASGTVTTAQPFSVT